ncbi:hypothetical protein V6N11_079675 [Hibiscus sabdariffa]|uniref:NB-ARC domain-containing protein n=1 Tax=Hibiscus sabdariffa TaxID=183260 RepID=A0ABR2RW32_9ROSI
MEAPISIVGSICGSIADIATENAVGPITRQLSYFFKHKTKFQNLRTKVQELKDAAQRVQQSVHQATMNGEKIFDDVEKWLTAVNEKISDQAAAQLEEDEEKSKRRCFAGCCPDLKSRDQHSKKAQTEAKTIGRLLNEKDQFINRVSYRPSVQAIIINRPVKEYVSFESRTGAFNGVMAALEDIMSTKLECSGWVTPNMLDIQSKIAEKLNLKFDETNVDVRAVRLHQRLRTEKKVLIILDDIWVTLNLEALGVPSADEHKGCKILMTSRTVAVAKRCGGLPIAIATIAKALKHKQNLFEWRNALRQLSKPSEGNFKGIAAEAYSAIELSYKFLDEKVQPIFLLSSIMGHDVVIEDLLRYARGSGLFHDVIGMKETRDEVYLGWLVSTKEDVYEIRSDEDIMRGCNLVSLRNAKSLEVISPGVLSSLTRLEELYLYHSFDRWEVKGIDYPRGNAGLVELQHLSCLTTLEKYENMRVLMLKTERSVKLYDGIKLLLRKAQNIEVVLNSMMLVPCLESLSLCDLTDLEAICDDQLKAGSFGRLRIIEVENCKKLKNLFSSIATELHQFEEIEVSCPVWERLYLKLVSGIEKIWSDDRFHVISFGVQSLTNMTIIKCHKLKYVFTSSMVKSFVNLKTLYSSGCDEMEEVIQGILGEKKEESACSCINLLPKLDYLGLIGLPNLRRFCCGIDIPIEFSSLKEMDIRKCPNLKTLALHCDSTNIDRKSSDNISLNQPQHFFNEKVMLPVLEKLDTKDMDNLERLWPNQFSQHSFSKLTSIQLGVEEIIFESHLQEEKGSSSRAMQSFSPQLIQSDDIISLFPCLTFLVLGGLPNLRSIHRERLTINWPSLEEMGVKGCDKVEILFASQETTRFPIQQPLFWVNQSTFLKLHKLTLGWNAGMKETWHCDGQQLVSHHFPNLEVVKLEDYTDQVLPLPSSPFYLHPIFKHLK